MRWPRRHVVKPTSASRLSVPSTTAVATDTDQSSHRSTGSRRRARHASQEASKLVVSGPTQTCWRVRSSSAASHVNWSWRVSRSRQGRRAVDAADDQLVAGRAVDEADVGLGREAAAHARGAHRGEERAAFAAGELEAVLAQAREVGRARRDPHAVLLLRLKASPPVLVGGRLLERGAGELGSSPAGERAGEGGCPAPGARLGRAVSGVGLTAAGSRGRAAPRRPLMRPPAASCCGARSANFAKRLRNASFSVPIGPFLCLARITSARP